MPKRKEVNEEPKRDLGMIQLLQEQVNTAEQGVLRAKEYVRKEEIRKERYQLKLDTYKETGELLSEEQLREKIPS